MSEKNEKKNKLSHDFLYHEVMPEPEGSRFYNEKEGKKVGVWCSFGWSDQRGMCSPSKKK